MIQSRPYSEEGRSNYDSIFRKEECSCGLSVCPTCRPQPKCRRCSSSEFVRHHKNVGGGKPMTEGEVHERPGVETTLVCAACGKVHEPVNATEVANKFQDRLQAARSDYYDKQCGTEGIEASAKTGITIDDVQVVFEGSFPKREEVTSDSAHRITTEVYGETEYIFKGSVSELLEMLSKDHPEQYMKYVGVAK